MKYVSMTKAGVIRLATPAERMDLHPAEIYIAESAEEPKNCQFASLDAAHYWLGLIHDRCEMQRQRGA